MADEQIVQNQGTQEQPAPEQGMPAEFGTPSMDNDAIKDILGTSDRTMAEPSIYPETEAVTNSPKVFTFTNVSLACDPIFVLPLIPTAKELAGLSAVPLFKLLLISSNFTLAVFTISVFK